MREVSGPPSLTRRARDLPGFAHPARSTSPAIALLATMFAAAWTGAGWAQPSEPRYIREYKAKGLPPLGDPLEFEHGTFPPQPKGATPGGTGPQVTARPRVPTERVIAQAREVALRDARTRSAIGERYAVVGGGEIDPAKGGTARTAQVRLVFFSYSRNRAIDVRLADDKVASVTVMPQGFQPAEGRDEVAAAAAIVGRDPRFADAVGGLTARGIEASKPGGNRQLYLLFYREGSAPAAFTATVDMIREQVVSGGPVQR